MKSIIIKGLVIRERRDGYLAEREHSAGVYEITVIQT
jgi:hypothetical protein